MHVCSCAKINIIETGHVGLWCQLLFETKQELVELETERYLVSHSVDCQRWRGTSRDDAVHSQAIRLQAVRRGCLKKKNKKACSATTQDGDDTQSGVTLISTYSNGFDVTLPHKIQSECACLRATAASVYQQQRSNTFYLGQN